MSTCDTRARRALNKLRTALLAVDRHVMWDLYSTAAWPTPDADVCNMVGHIDAVLKDNARWLPPNSRRNPTTLPS